MDLNKYIYRIYEASTDGNWLDVLETIRHVTNSNKVFFLIRDVEKKQILENHLIANFAYDPNIASGFLNNFDKDPWYHHSKIALEGEIVRPSVEVPVSEFNTLDIYQQFYTPLRTQYCVGAIILRDHNYESFLICNRGTDSTEYSKHDINFLSSILPHIQQSVNIYLTLESYKKSTNYLQAISRSTSSGVVLCNYNLEIIELNKIAENLIKTHCSLKPNTKKLSLISDYLNAELQKAVNLYSMSNDKRLNHRHDLYVQSENSSDLLLSVFPIPGHTKGSDGHQECIIKINTSYHVNWPTVQNKFGLTAKEIDVLKLVHQKKTVEQTAEHLNVKVNTIRTHLQNVYAKLEVNSQLSLMHILSLFGK